MTTTPPAMAEALQRLWTKFLPEIEHRLAILQSASDALAAGAISNDEREAGHQAAHKLAGVLGTFGLHQGTDLARKAELLLADGETAPVASNLSIWLQELRKVIDSRQPDTAPTKS